MSHGKTAMMLMAALALPRAADALGLGEIHVESALNEPLAAQIDLVGVTDEDLSGITASIANRDTFQRFGVDRPAFLSTTEFKIVRAAGGRAVLVVRSKDSFTEPLVDLLIDLRWHGGETIRQYTLLMDPPGMAQATRPTATPAAASEPAPATVASPAPALSPSIDSSPVAAPIAAPPKTVARAKAARSRAGASPTTDTAVSTTAPGTIKVGPRATLRSVVARHLGVRGEAERTRMMIALFHANPSAFDGNINRLRRGAVVNIPAATALAAISVADARSEFHAQMQAWRPTAKLASAKPGSPKAAPPQAAPPQAAPSQATPSQATPQPSIVPLRPAAVPSVAAELPASSRDSEALDKRVKTLEKGLGEMQDLLDQERDKLIRVQATLVHEQKAAAAIAVAPKHSMWQFVGWPLATASALLIGWFAAFRLARRPPTDSMSSNGEPNFAGSFEPATSSTAAAASTLVPASSSMPVPCATGPAAVTQAPSPAPAAASSETQEARDSDAEFAAKLAALGVLEGIDVESLEASYVFDVPHPEPKVSPDAETAQLPSVDTAKLLAADTAKLIAADTARLVAVGEAANAEDPNAETMPVETVQLPISASKAADDATVENTQLDYNLVDLDSTAHHVQMPSRLHENVGFKERRTTLVDALKLAIEREPNRRDLRMKLLETYYAAAAMNRQGFLDLVRTLAEDGDQSSGDDWNKVLKMGRQIASDNELFAAETADEKGKDLANCA